MFGAGVFLYLKKEAKEKKVWVYSRTLLSMTYALRNVRGRRNDKKKWIKKVVWNDSVEVETAQRRIQNWFIYCDVIGALRCFALWNGDPSKNIFHIQRITFISALYFLIYLFCFAFSSSECSIFRMKWSFKRSLSCDRTPNMNPNQTKLFLLFTQIILDMIDHSFVIFFRNAFYKYHKISIYISFFLL